MGSEALRQLVAGLVLVLLATACADSDPYEALAESQLEYVIPGSDDWGPGNPCDDADCAGAVTVEILRDLSWTQVTTIEATEGEVGDESTIEIEVGDDRTLRAWGDDVHMALGRLESGLELWAGSRDGHVLHFIALDDSDRFAGIGFGAALMVTVPLAQEMAASAAPSARVFLEEIIA